MDGSGWVDGWTDGRGDWSIGLLFQCGFLWPWITDHMPHFVFLPLFVHHGSRCPRKDLISEPSLLLWACIELRLQVLSDVFRWCTMWNSSKPKLIKCCSHVSSVLIFWAADNHKTQPWRRRINYALKKKECHSNKQYREGTKEHWARNLGTAFHGVSTTSNGRIQNMYRICTICSNNSHLDSWYFDFKAHFTQRIWAKIRIVHPKLWTSAISLTMWTLLFWFFRAKKDTSHLTTLLFLPQS